jgi:DNA-directed RNA polymerase subunit RPC12/RpoP
VSRRKAAPGLPVENIKRRITIAEFRAGRSRNGGYTAAQLARWGVSWPPIKGWKERLIKPDDPFEEEIEALVCAAQHGKALPIDLNTPIQTPYLCAECGTERKVIVPLRGHIHANWTPPVFCPECATK